MTSLADISRRAIVDADMPFLRDLYGETRAEELARVPWPDEEKRLFLASQFELQNTHYRRTMPDAEYWLLERRESPVGRLYIDDRPGEIGLVEVSLIAAERGHGLGTALILETQRRASEQDKPVRLYVEQFNRARHLYERLGFSYCGEHGPYFHMEWFPVIPK